MTGFFDIHGSPLAQGAAVVVATADCGKARLESGEVTHVEHLTRYMFTASTMTVELSGGGVAYFNPNEARLRIKRI